MRRRLLNIASIACLVLCVVLMGLWVRSYCQSFQVATIWTGVPTIEIGSTSGRLSLNEAMPDELGWHSIYSETVEDSWTAPNGGWLAVHRKYFWGSLGFAAFHSSSFSFCTVPYWFAVLAVGLLAMLFQLRWPWRFNVRLLFIATTFLAVVLGMIAWLDRAWIGK
jgi:hypothetical protein